MDGSLGIETVPLRTLERLVARSSRRSMILCRTSSSNTADISVGAVPFCEASLSEMLIYVSMPKTIKSAISSAERATMIIQSRYGSVESLSARLLCGLRGADFLFLEKIFFMVVIGSISGEPR